MIRNAAVLIRAAVAVFLVASPASAQTLDGVCPGGEEGTGALWGAVQDSDTETVLPGASVIASWKADGREQQSEVQAGFDGAYTMCHIPLETDVAVYASFANMRGTPLEVAMTDIFTRLDLVLSMTGAGGSDGDDRVWLCIDGGESLINIQFARLLRCDQNWQPLERCPKEELGRISVQPVGAGSGMMREMIEQFVQEAKRIGANAVINVRDGRGGTSFGGIAHFTSISGEGVRIEVDPLTC